MMAAGSEEARPHADNHVKLLIQSMIGKELAKKANSLQLKVRFVQAIENTVSSPQYSVKAVEVLKGTHNANSLTSHDPYLKAQKVVT